VFVETISLTIEGMTCAHCVRAVREALEKLPSTEIESVEIGSATVKVDPEQVDEEALVDAIADEGYTAFRSNA
jgi:copper chaperone CopZ